MTQITTPRRAGMGGIARAAVLLAVIMAVLAVASPARASTYIVDHIGDNGDLAPGDGICAAPSNQPQKCTLRAAIEEANARSGADNINFDIPESFGAGVKTIRPNSPLPTIVDEVVIDGYTQPGASPNTLARGTNAVLLVELSGENAGEAIGLRLKFLQGSDNVGSVVRGLVVNRFSATGISVEGGVSTRDFRIEGNFIGTDPSGTQKRANGQGVFFNGFRSDIGGISPDALNLISGNDGIGVTLGNVAASTAIRGNLIGTRKDGTSALGNSLEGIALASDGISQGSPNSVGGRSAASANIIAFNGGDGVRIGGCTFVPGTGERVCGTGKSILRNSIFSNGGLGIDLAGGIEDATDRTANDPGDLDDTDDGPNRLQNSPVLTSAVSTRHSTTIRGKLSSTPDGAFVIRLFSNRSGNEGKRFIGQKRITTDRSGDATFSFTPVRAVAAGHKVTATATSAGDDTSEFSAPKVVKQK